MAKKIWIVLVVLLVVALGVVRSFYFGVFDQSGDDDVLMGRGVEKDIELESSVQRINFSVYINDFKMDEWWVSYLKDDSVSNVEVRVGGYSDSLGLI